MLKYCNCTECLKGSDIVNPYEFTEGAYSLDDVPLIFDPRSAAMCKYGCTRFNAKATCPPNVPDIVSYKRMLSAYSWFYVIGRRYPYSDSYFSKHWRTYSTNEIHSVLLKKELELFKQGEVYAKAFIGGSCKVCPEGHCRPDRCNVPSRGRVPLEATGVNVFSLIGALGLDYQEPPIDYFWRIGVVFY